MGPEKLTVIGWKESIDLPEWGIRHITAKADTGARRSAIDVANIKELSGTFSPFWIGGINRKASNLP